MKLALITGASHGLGAALALELVPAFHVVAVGRTVGALEELDDRIKAKGGEATLAPMDITNADAMRQLADAIATRWGRVDLWVHTAVHAAPLGPVAYSDDKDWDKSVACNVTATRTLITQIAPLLAGGRAVFFDDPRAGQPFFASYGATKAAQIALAQSWQAEARADSVTVDIVTPDPMATATRARFFPGEPRGPLATTGKVAHDLVQKLGLI
jgi:NAD(P)-dependent dehydrogenase (short-subunit alcohol dehydrogenase family)